MNVLIIGAGAIGIAAGTMLLQGGADLSFYVLPDTKKAIEQNGISRTGLFGEVQFSPDNISLYEKYEDMPNNYFDYVIVSTKTMFNSDTAEKLLNVKNIFKPNGKIVIFQNGWATEKAFVNRFPKEMVYNARIISGFELNNLSQSNITVHTGDLLLGSLFGYDSEAVKPLAETIAKSGFPANVTDEIEKALWAKMLYNTTLNPIGAIIGCPYGGLVASEQSKTILSNLIEETFAVMNAAGYKTYWKTAEDYKQELFNNLLPNTVNHRSSTLQDIEKKIKTEIDTLNGCVIEIGKEFGVETPTHLMIYRIIKGIEANF